MDTGDYFKTEINDYQLHWQKSWPTQQKVSDEFHLWLIFQASLNFTDGWRKQVQQFIWTFYLFLSNIFILKNWSKLSFCLTTVAKELSHRWFKVKCHTVVATQNNVWLLRSKKCHTNFVSHNLSNDCCTTRNQVTVAKMKFITWLMRHKSMKIEVKPLLSIEILRQKMWHIRIIFCCPMLELISSNK